MRAFRFLTCLLCVSCGSFFGKPDDDDDDDDEEEDEESGTETTVSDDDTGATDDSGTTSGSPRFEEFVNIEEAYVGDASCYDGGAWLEQAAGSGCTVDQTLYGVVEDFQEGEPIGETTVDLYFRDDIGGSPSESFETTSDSEFIADVPVCEPIAYRTSTPVEWEQTKDTYRFHKVWGFDADGDLEETLDSFSNETAAVITALLGVNWDSSTGLIAGMALGCDEDPIENVQVYIHDDAGQVPQELSVSYFVAGLPRSSQPATSEDGLWIAVNVPPGTWTVAMWGFDGSDHTQLGQAPVEVVAASVHIANVYTGSGDGVWLPDSCLRSCN